MPAVPLACFLASVATCWRDWSRRVEGRDAPAVVGVVVAAAAAAVVVGVVVAVAAVVVVAVVAA